MIFESGLTDTLSPPPLFLIRVRRLPQHEMPERRRDRFGRVVLPRLRLEGDDANEVRRILYGLHAVLTLHFSQEDESYLSLADDETRVSKGT